MTDKIRKPFIRRKVAGISFDPKEGRTKGSFKDECNINYIMNKYLKTGQLPNVRENLLYGEASGLDLFEAQQLVAKANSMFEELPSNVRNKFENDQSKFLDFINDDKNLEEMIELGIAERKPDEVIPKVEIVNLEKQGATTQADPAE